MDAVPRMFPGWIDIQRGNQSVSLFSRPHKRSIKYFYKIQAITACKNFQSMHWWQNNVNIWTPGILQTLCIILYFEFRCLNNWCKLQFLQNCQWNLSSINSNLSLSFPRRQKLYKYINQDDGRESLTTASPPPPTLLLGRYGDHDKEPIWQIQWSSRSAINHTLPPVSSQAEMVCHMCPNEPMIR